MPGSMTSRMTTSTGVRACVGERLVAGRRRRARSQPDFCEVVGDQLGDVAVVFGDEDVHRRRIIPRGSGDAEEQPRKSS